MDYQAPSTIDDAGSSSTSSLLGTPSVTLATPNWNGRVPAGEEEDVSEDGIPLDTAAAHHLVKYFRPHS